MKADPFATLGLPLEASDADIRKRYLELTVQFPPEQHADKFAAVREAYERIRTLDNRAKYMLHERGTEDTIEAILEEVECTTPRPRPSLSMLVQMLSPKT
jgi:curved DNA-binding protein CbpA